MTMPRVMGLDLSLASTGVALPDGTLRTIVTRKEDEPARRLHLITGGIRHLAHDPRQPHKWPVVDLVVLERLVLHGKGAGGAQARAELAGCVKRDLFVAGIPYVEVNPARLKRWATGNGAADKDAMVAAARQLGYRPQNTDEADAALLRELGRHAYGALVIERYASGYPGDAVLAARLEVVAAITWPVLHDGTARA